MEISNKVSRKSLKTENLKYLLRIFVVIVVICNIDTGFLTVEVPFHNARPAKVFYSDGTVRTRSTEGLSICGLGDKTFMLNHPNGRCNTKYDIHPKKDLFNKITSDYDRLQVGDKPYTLIDEEIFKDFDEKSQRILYKVLAKGRIAETSDMELKSGGIQSAETVTDLKVPVLTLSPGTIVKAKTSDVKICEYETEGCFDTVASGGYPKRVVLAKGRALGALLVAEGKKTWAKVIPKVENYLSYYFPLDDIEVVPYPVAIDRDDAYDLGVRFSPSALEDISQATEIKNSTERKKRFAAIGVASAALGISITTQQSMYAGFKASDQKDAEQIRAINRAEVYAKDMGQRMYEITNVAMSSEIYQGEINGAQEELYIMLSETKIDVELLEDHFLWMIGKKNSEPQVLIENKDRVNEFIKSNYSEAQILSIEYSTTSAVVSMKLGETILSGKYKPDEFIEAKTFANGEGKWSYWQRKNQVTVVENPILTIAHCGIIFRINDATQEGVLSTSSNFNEFIEQSENAIKNGYVVEYVYVNKILCPAENYILSGSTLPRYEFLRKIYGLPPLMINDDNNFYVGPTDINDTKLSLINEDYNIGRQLAMEDLKVLVAQMEPTEFSKISAFDAAKKASSEWSIFKAAVTETGKGFEDVGRAIGKAGSGFWDGVNGEKIDMGNRLAIAALVIAVLDFVLFGLNLAFLVFGCRSKGGLCFCCRKKVKEPTREEHLEDSEQSGISFDAIQPQESKPTSTLPF